MSSSIIKGIAIISGVYGLILGIKNVQSLTYFTNLSNILILAILLLSLVFDIIRKKSGGKKNPKTRDIGSAYREQIVIYFKSY